MNSKERVRRSVHFETPDRIPMFHSFLWGGLNELGEGLREVFRRYPGDISGQNPDSYDLNSEMAQRYINKCTWTDEWGCVWDFPGLGVEGIPVDGPLYKGWEGLKNLEMPEVDTNREKPADADTHYTGDIIPGIRLFERMHILRGFENMLMDIAYDSEEVYVLRDKIVDWQIENLKPLLDREYVDFFATMDDWGSQTGLLISPETWRKIFKPAYKKVFSMVRDAGKDLFFHSDGLIIDIIPDLIELGVNILNPQFSCMTTEQLGQFNGKLCFAADIDRQNLMSFGTVDEVRENVLEWIHAVASPKGGILGKAEIGPGVPLENAEIAYKTFYEFRF